MPWIRRLVATLLLAACAGSDATATVAPQPAPAPVPTPTATPNETPPADPAPPDVAVVDPAPPIDVADLTGHVSSREGSRDIPPRLAARITAIDRGTPGVWRIEFAADGRTHHVKVQVPEELPPPLRPGDDVVVQVRGTGGGPNYFLTLIFTAPDGGLLLAVGAAPADWRVARGKAGRVDRGDDYNERHHGVTFEHAGVRVAVEAGGWARMDVGGATFHVWGSAVQRRLRPGKRPMPDYVGGWLDYAIVRAR